jgi:hypothetical protein
MERIWQIEEQTIEDNATKLRLEFSSVYTDAVNAGEDPPSRDELIVLRLWTSDRTRLATFTFERNGKLLKSEIEPVATPADLPGRGADISCVGGVLAELQNLQDGRGVG